MKNTTYAITNSQADGASHLARSDRRKAWPYLVWMLSSGLPLNYQLKAEWQMGMAEVAEQTLAATSGANTLSSIPFALFIGGLYFCAAWMLLRKPKIVLAILSRQWPLFLLMLYIAASAFWSFNPDKVLSNTIHNLGALCICLAAALRYRHEPWLFPKQLGYVLGVNMLLHLAAIVAIPAYAIDFQDRWQGLTPHPNTFGAFALATLWANAAVLIYQKSDKHHFHLIFSALAIVAMIGADSVTSMISSACVILAIYTLKRLEMLKAGRKFYISVVAIGASLVLIMLAVGSALDFGGLFGMFGRDANLTGRTSLWADAFAAISSHPILGWSFDDHTYIIKTQGMAYYSYHNGFLDLAVSGGAVAIVLLVLLFGTWIAGFTKRFMIAAQIIPFSASFGFAYLVHNLTEASFVSPRGQLWMIFLALVCLGACRKSPASNIDQGVRPLAPAYRQGPILSQVSGRT